MGTVANIKVQPMNVTWNSIDLGFIDGDIEFTLEEQMVDITCHQTGTQLVDQIRTGVNLEVAMTLKETDAASIKQLLEIAGKTETPTAGTPVTGYGEGNRFTNVSADAAKLILSPVGAADATEDFAFPLAYPKLESITFSGENPSMVPVSFTILPSATQDTDVNLFTFGDHTQDLTDPIS